MTEAEVQTGRRWTVRVPACEWLTANDRRWRQGAQIIRSWRESVVMACRAARLPTDGVGPVRIHASVRFAGNRAPVRDRLNLAPTIKAIVDGLGQPKLIRRDGRAVVNTVGYGFLWDDSDRHVLDTTWDIAPSGSARAWVDLSITEVVADV